MRRCYRGAALAMGGVLMTTSFASFHSCRAGALKVYAAQGALTEEMETAFQEEALTGEENVETEIPEEEAAAQPKEERMPESKDYQALLKIVEAEAGGEDTAGKMLVANVVMNRVRSGHFPNSITEVVYQRSGGRAQFSPTVDGRIDRVQISEDTVEAVARVLSGEDISAGALYFRSVHSKSGWFDRTLNRVVEHGNHIFYSM